MHIWASRIHTIHIIIYSCGRASWDQLAMSIRALNARRCSAHRTDSRCMRDARTMASDRLPASCATKRSVMKSAWVSTGRAAFAIATTVRFSLRIFFQGRSQCREGLRMQAVRQSLQALQHLIDTSPYPQWYPTISMPVLRKALPSEERHEEGENEVAQLNCRNEILIFLFLFISSTSIRTYTPVSCMFRIV